MGAFGEVSAEGGAAGMSRPGKGGITRAPEAVAGARRQRRGHTAAGGVASGAGSERQQEFKTSWLPAKWRKVICAQRPETTHLS